MTTATTQTIADFLEQRVAEDEAAARLALPQWQGQEDGAVLGDLSYQSWNFTRRHDPARVLAECKAKRKIIAECEEVVTARWITDRVLMHLAAPYADRPDFDPSWRA